MNHDPTGRTECCTNPTTCCDAMFDKIDIYVDPMTGKHEAMSSGREGSIYAPYIVQPWSVPLDPSHKTVLESYGGGIALSYFAGPNAYFVYPANTLKTWTSPSTLVTTVPTPDPGQIGDPTFIGDTMFFALENTTYHRIKVFSPTDGIRDLVSYGNDPQRGASDIGTDGKDMVWTEASGRPSPSGPWTTIDIMTAPFTTDPGAIVKRRLRSETRQFGGNEFVVGCGYAAHEASLSTFEPGMRIVRLADGRSWRFGKIVAETGPNWQIGYPLAITCDEVFVLFQHGYQFNVARIRLDSLGPGDPPD